MSSRPSEAAIDAIVASCSGDIRGALKALLLVNEHLEAELQQLYAAVALAACSSAATAPCISTACSAAILAVGGRIFFRAGADRRAGKPGIVDAIYKDRPRTRYRR